MIRLYASLFLVIVLFPFTGYSLSLDEGLRIVAESGRDIRIAQSEEEVARGAVWLARSPWLPWVDLYGRETWLRDQPGALTPFGAMPTSQDQFYTYGFKATQLIYDFGKTSSAVNAAQYGLQAKEADTLRTRNRSALEFIAAYLDLLEAERLLQVAADEVKRYEAHRRDTDERYRAGVITRNEVLQADVTLSDSRQKLLTEDNLRSLRASKVNSLLLRPLNDDTRAEELAASPSAGISLDDAWAVAEAESPELKELDAAIRSKEASVSAARSEYLPNIYVAGGYEYQENRYMVHEDNWSLIAGVNINLFSGGASSARIRMGKGEVYTLKMTREKLLDSVRLAVKGAYLDLQSSSKKIDVTKTAVAQAEENLRLQRLRYQEGVGTATEVLDAVTLLTVAQTNFWKAVYGLKRAEANLLYAMGRDLVGLYGK